MSELDEAPIRGLPEHLPAGERILWQGAPAWRSLAVRAFHVRKIALYCGALLLWSAIADIADGRSVAAAVLGAVWLTPIALAACALPAGLAWLFARTSVYTITDRRLVMRVGVALPMSINLPFGRIAAADLKLYRDGTGDLPLRLGAADKIAYLALWPHARPWHVSRPEPMLRALAQPQAVAQLLAQAIAAVPAAPVTTAAAAPAAAAEALKPLVEAAA